MKQEDFIEILKSHNSAPFLFIGSGFSRHYLNTPDWKGLLAYFSPCHINKYYSESPNGDLPLIASAIARDVNDAFWKLPDTDSFKIKNMERVDDGSMALKIKISEYLHEKSTEEIPKELMEEIQLLQSVNVDGVITTNWDDLIERIFPRYNVFVGQDELIFSPTFNIGEIFKIHGCFKQPKSMILTDEDYKDFNDRNAYLAAKLITIFVEHPIVFMGYSMSDENIISLLRSIVFCMDKEKIVSMQNNLIFVEWDPNPQVQMQIDYSSIVLNNDINLPVIRVKVHHYKEVYECLKYYERRIPANMLREYKKQFYEIVVSEHAESRMYVLPDSKIEDRTDIQFVCGFGAVNKFMTASGYTGITSTDILRDCIDDQGYDALQILNKSFPCILNAKKKIFIPIYKYLRAIGVKSDDEYRNHQLGFNMVLRKYDGFKSYRSVPEVDKSLSLKALIDKYNGDEVWRAVVAIPYINISRNDIDLLHEFIRRNFNDFFVTNKYSRYKTHMRKLICLLDFVKNGWN